VATTRRHYKGRVYEAHLLRRSYREDGKIKNETVGNLSHLPGHLIEIIRRSLKGEAFLGSAEALEVVRSLPHGDAAAVYAQARALGFPEILGPACRERDLAPSPSSSPACCAPPPSWRAAATSPTPAWGRTSR